MILLKGFLQALSMYSTIPVPGLRWNSRSDRHMLVMYPLVGLVIGAIWLGAARLLLFLGLPPILSAAVLTAAPFFLTGFLHLDGFMDVCDAVLSRRDKARRLEILRDSHTGAFAVISVLFLLLFQYAAVFELFKSPDKLWVFLLLPCLSRGWSGLGLLKLPLLEGSAMGAWARMDTTKVHQAVLAVLALVSGGSMAVLCGWPGVAAAVAATLVYWLAVSYGVRQLGGVSGDVSGYAQCLGELAALIAAVLALA